MKEPSYLHHPIAMLLPGCPKAHSFLSPTPAIAIDLQRQQQGSRLEFSHAEMKTIHFLFPSKYLYKQRDKLDKQYN